MSKHVRFSTSIEVFYTHFKRTNLSFAHSNETITRAPAKTVLKKTNQSDDINNPPRIDKYEILELLGEGGYGEVRRATDRSTKKEVAIKWYKKENGKKGTPKKVQIEVNILRMAIHPNVMKIIEVVFSRKLKNVFLVTEYIPYVMEDLLETDETKFPEHVARYVLQGILRGTAHLHSLGIIHRDLKPDNILITENSEIKIIDFGMAIVGGKSMIDYVRSFGTRWYRAPEVLLKCDSYNSAVDMWAIGCIFAKLLNIYPLFSGNTSQDVFEKICFWLGEPPTVPNVDTRLKKRLQGKVSQSGYKILEGLLTYDPFDRLTADDALSNAYFSEDLPV